ncbi:DUF1360 domain-containing protein [Streptomyces sp. NPDC006326]|uniref:DUF1360 domain-containing protein n=1 Tax=Streptomyces sp. NPDC006326 TaxID=3156752 RepID=UPI0033A3AE1A
MPVRLVGALARTVARVRGRPALHPGGLLVSGFVDVQPDAAKPWSVPFLDRPGRYEAVVRWSRAAGLPGPLPDGMGLAVHVIDAGTDPPGREFDLLLTSSGTSRFARHLPLPRLRGDVPYSTLTGYCFPDRERVIAAFPAERGRRLPTGGPALTAELRERPVRFRLCAAADGEPWRPFATLTLHPEPPAASRTPHGFDPYGACLPDLRPSPRLRRLRQAAYAGSREGRAAARGDEDEASTGRVAALAAFGAYAGCWALLVRRRGSVGAHPVSVYEVLLTGTATFRLSRLITKAKVTRPLRAPFTDVEEAGAPAELNEVPKHSHPALGELLSCPFCLSVWVATSLTGARMLFPRATSAVVRTAAAVAVSDALQIGYSALVSRAEAADRSR